jgi:hypothetical protein
VLDTAGKKTSFFKSLDMCVAVRDHLQQLSL